MLFTIGNGLLRTFMSPMCAACRTPLAQPLDGPVCPACWSAVPRISPPWCHRCGDMLASDRDLELICPRCVRTPPAFDAARSAGLYEGPLRELIHALKYEGRRAVAPELAALMAREGREILGDADAVIPVPLHPFRALHRGFNQADDLSAHLSRPVWRVLKRVRAGPPQSTLPADRRHLIAGAFAVRTHIWVRGGPTGTQTALRGRTVVLIDDVMTTGATLNACSEALVAAGVAGVRVLTAARAVAGRPPSPLPPQPHATAQRR